MSNRTFKITNPHMRGDDIKNWQLNIKDEFLKLGIVCPLKFDSIYGITTRSYTASLCHALGMTASEVMSDGVTPELRMKIRNRTLTAEERSRFEHRSGWRRDLREKFASSVIHNVHRPVKKIIADSWGYHPGVHDGIDVICEPNAHVYAMVKSKVIDVRFGGWWGKAPSGDVTKGDGIVQLEVLETVGPFLKGYHIGYGHCEHANVKVGDVVESGTYIADAGLAVAWHIHLMYNTGTTTKGIGNIDPRKILDYAVKNG